ncbi:uncharacterized protein LOC127873345 isoform X2 [Dreissena polymorpha]|uniref:uncharacterized protein LOC127873345 isoform X2 n=1 Tax=Dreissena polymorpha TaxID=45954 RepID=UPI002263D878|nr:uncharacterized protein LOC127873345 isoform X2 [Dreissena polymorpha]
MRDRDGCEQRVTGLSKVYWKGNLAVKSSNIVFAVIPLLLLNGCLALDLKVCMKTCINQKDLPIQSICPEIRACDWICEAYYKNCPGNTKYHCAKSATTGNYTRECALPVTCTEGTEPVITKKNGSPVVYCVPCPDKMYYNSAKNLSSDTFSNCHEKKSNQCTDEFQKKDCAKERGQKPWDEQSISDGFCRCDARNGYAPFDDSSLFKHEYCFTRAENCRKVYCENGMELSLNYVCIPKCPFGFNRTKLSDECKNLTGLTTREPISYITEMQPSTEPATISPPKPVTTSNENGLVCCCCKERLRQLRCQLRCQLCGAARTEGANNVVIYSPVPTDPSGTLGSHVNDCRIEMASIGVKNEEANGFNHVDNSQNMCSADDLLPNNGDNNYSAGDDATETFGSTSQKDRKEMGSRHREKKNKTIIKNYKTCIKVKGNLNHYHKGSSTQVEGLHYLIEETEALCSNNTNKSNANDQEESGSEDMEVDAKNYGTESTEQTGDNHTQNSGTSDGTLCKTMVTDCGDGHISDAASDGDVCTNSTNADSCDDCSPGLVEKINVEEVFKETDMKTGKRENVGNLLDIVKYAGTEWSLSNKKACLLTEAYACVKRNYRFPYIRVIRGDNYCAIRSTIFQILVYCFPLPKDWSSCDTDASDIKSDFCKRVISQFKFAECRNIPVKESTELVPICLKGYYEMAQKLQEYSTIVEKQNVLAEALNSDADCDLNIMEAVKLLMAQCAVNLFVDKEGGKKVPEWARHLFDRDGSKTVEQLISNHLNKVGHECGLEQVEMCLLGYSLGVRIRVLRLIYLNEVDFEAFYPPEDKDDLPVVTLISEDDRHYNIPVE